MQNDDPRVQQYAKTFKLIRFQLQDIATRYSITTANPIQLSLQIQSFFNSKTHYEQIPLFLKQLFQEHNVPFMFTPNLFLELKKNQIFYGEFNHNRLPADRWIIVNASGKMIVNEAGVTYTVLKSGSIYHGTVRDTKPDGEGAFRWANGELFVGRWAKGQKHGIGEWVGLRGDYYIGEWVNGKAQGVGEHRWMNGDNYVGQFFNNLKHGYGIEYFANGDTYIGNYSQGLPNGVGEYRWKAGAIYKGQFSDGLRVGFGRWWKDGQYFEGNYSQDMRNGIGKYLWPNNVVYEGNFANDKREGYGEMIWEDGSNYKGEWVQNKMHGYGVMMHKDGSVVRGQWQENHLIEQARDQSNAKMLQLSKGRSKSENKNHSKGVSSRRGSQSFRSGGARLEYKKSKLKTLVK